MSDRPCCSPGDQVFIDGDTEPSQCWKVVAVVCGVDFFTGDPTSIHTLKRGNEVAFSIPAKRITAHWVGT